MCVLASNFFFVNFQSFKVYIIMNFIALSNWNSLPKYLMRKIFNDSINDLKICPYIFLLLKNHHHKS